MCELIEETKVDVSSDGRRRKGDLIVYIVVAGGSSLALCDGSTSVNSLGPPVDQT